MITVNQTLEVCDATKADCSNKLGTKKAVCIKSF